jgi:hypothetical protein
VIHRDDDDAVSFSKEPSYAQFKSVHVSPFRAERDD